MKYYPSGPTLSATHESSGNAETEGLAELLIMTPSRLGIFRGFGSVETERNRVGFVISRRLGGPARDLSSVRVYHTRRASLYGVSGCRRYAL
jgi:hypothetical protein